MICFGGRGWKLWFFLFRWEQARLLGMAVRESCEQCPFGWWNISAGKNGRWRFTPDSRCKPLHSNWLRSAMAANFALGLVLLVELWDGREQVLWARSTALAWAGGSAQLPGLYVVWTTEFSKSEWADGAANALNPDGGQKFRLSG